ncbi:hypothetical protein ACYX8G_06280 [Microbacterium saperdae]
MAPQTTEQLHAELARLTAEKDELRRQLVAAREDGESSASMSRVDRPRRRAWGWTILSTALVTIGAVLTPVAIVSTWAHRELTDTSYFVATFAPLAEDPAVQDFVAGQSVAAIESAIDIDRIADDLFAGLEGLELAPRATEALGLLKAPAVAGVKGLIDDTVTEFVRSDVFAVIWKDALTVTHRQLVSTATGQNDAAVSVGQNQEISLQLGPIIRSVKEQLVADGFTLAAQIPEIDRSIVIAESSSVGIYITIYQLVVALGIWLPWVSFLFLAAGVLIARRRAVALIWTSGAVLLTMVLVGAGIGVGTGVFALAVAESIPHDAAVALYSGILGFVSSIVLVMAVLAATVLIVTAFAGPWQWARRLCAHASAAFAAIRHAAEQRGITTGGFGAQLHRWRMPLRVLVGLGCFAVLLLSRPLSPSTIVWTALVGVILVAVLELVARPPGTLHAASDGAAHTRTMDEEKVT